MPTDNDLHASVHSPPVSFWLHDATDDDLRAYVQGPAVSYWLRDALTLALSRDPVDAAEDAGLLSLILDRRVKAMTARNLNHLTVQTLDISNLDRMQTPSD